MQKYTGLEQLKSEKMMTECPFLGECLNTKAVCFRLCHLTLSNLRHLLSVEGSAQAADVKTPHVFSAMRAVEFLHVCIFN